MTDTTLTFTRDLTASANAVWRCWSEPELLRKWFAPKPVVTSHAEIDARPGGRFDTTMQVPGMEEPMSGEGCIIAAEPGRRIAFTNMMKADFQPQDTSGPGEFPFTAEMIIEPRDTGCRYTVIVRHLTEKDTEAHKAMGFFDGWGTAATQMDELAVTLD